MVGSMYPPIMGPTMSPTDIMPVMKATEAARCSCRITSATAVRHMVSEETRPERAEAG